MRDRVVAASAQYPLEYLAPEKNAAAAVAAIEGAAARGADLVVCPEVGNVGYPADTGTDTKAAYCAAAEPLGGQYTEALREAAVRTGAHVVGGFAERHPRLTGVLANTAALFAPDGTVHLRRKTHLPRIERQYFRPGDGLSPVDTALGRIGMLVCADNSFPEPARVLALAGADIITVSYFAPAVPNPVMYHAITATRAYENQVFVVAADACGTHNGYTLAGSSAIGAPDGALLDSLGTEPGTALAELRAETLLTARLHQPRYQDRRPELYGSLVEPGFPDAY